MSSNSLSLQRLASKECRTQMLEMACNVEILVLQQLRTCTGSKLSLKGKIPLYTFLKNPPIPPPSIFNQNIPKG